MITIQNRNRRVVVTFGSVLIATAAIAVTSQQLIDAGMPANCVDFAKAVSSTEGNWNTTKPPTGPNDTKYCYGAFQFCSGRKSAVGGTFGQYNPGWTPQDFLNSPKQQVTAWTQYERDRWGDIQRSSSMSGLLGQSVCYNGKCATIDESALLKAAQFGTGGTSPLALYAKDHSCSHGDAYNTSVCKYMIQGAGKDASCFTGKQSNNQGKNNNGGGCPSGPGDFPTTPAPTPAAATISA